MVGPAVAVVGFSARRCGAVPAQQCVGGDQPPGSARSWERRRYRFEQAPVGVGEFGAVDLVLAAQHTELVAQHDDLKVLRAARTYSEANQRNEEAVDDAVHEDPASARIAAGQRPRPSFRHPQAQLRHGPGRIIYRPRVPILATRGRDARAKVPNFAGLPTRRPKGSSTALQTRLGLRRPGSRPRRWPPT